MSQGGIIVNVADTKEIKEGGGVIEVIHSERNNDFDCILF